MALDVAELREEALVQLDELQKTLSEDVAFTDPRDPRVLAAKPRDLSLETPGPEKGEAPQLPLPGRMPAIQAMRWLAGPTHPALSSASA